MLLRETKWWVNAIRRNATPRASLRAATLWKLRHRMVIQHPPVCAAGAVDRQRQSYRAPTARDRRETFQTALRWDMWFVPGNRQLHLHRQFRTAGTPDSLRKSLSPLASTALRCARLPPIWVCHSWVQWCRRLWYACADYWDAPNAATTLRNGARAGDNRIEWRIRVTCRLWSSFFVLCLDPDWNLRRLIDFLTKGQRPKTKDQ